MTRRHTASWGQAFPGWDLLPDPGLLPLRAAGSLARWWWPTAAVVGFLAVIGYVLGHDDPHPGMSNRSWLTVVLAAVVVVLLTIHRASRGRLPRAPLARALAEYAVVALLAVLLVTAGSQQPAERVEDGAGRHQSTQRPADRRQPAGHDRRRPAERADAGAADRRPGIVRVVTGVWGFITQLWRDAGELADRSTPPTSTTTPKEGT